METPRTNSNTNPGLSSTTDSMMNKASSGAHATVDKMAAAADEAARKAKPAIDRATEFAHQAVDRAQSAAAPAAAWLGDQTGGVARPVRANRRDPAGAERRLGGAGR